MSKKIYIDAVFPDETRIVSLDAKDMIDSIDRETPSIKQLKGNIYLDNIIRVEPSLQAAFINYGGDRHGFLPFSDVHPDYYNIPEERKNDLTAVKFFNEIFEKELTPNNIDISIDEDLVTEATSDDFEEENFVKIENNEVVIDVCLDEVVDTENVEEQKSDKTIDCNENNSEELETKLFYDEYKKNKIETVLKEGQSLLVQVTKEERGNKGVALTTYISIAGKYSVLMANVEGKGGISKKVTNIRDRKILKNILNTINPSGRKSIIIRTAGIGKRPEDILRDYVYLSRLWTVIKEETIKQVSPAFIHSEDDILKRSVRDLLDDDILEIIIAGKDAFKTIKNLVNLMMPNSKIVIREYDDKIPLFHKTGIEEQILQLYDNKITLPSGASIVIDQTEALVAIDINSGKATKQTNVEEMAVAINLEAIKEIAKQLRLRDIGGLIVIDFIDMDIFKNRRLVERAMHDAFAHDKARIQMDRISIFGLMEMSRQRINASFGEKISEKCPHCDGKGTVRSKYIVGENILRNIKYCASRDKNSKVFTVESTKEIIEYLLNYKRDYIKKIEQEFEINVIVSVNSEKINNNYSIEKRESLTPIEKLDLLPVQNVGIINELFEDSDFYKNNDLELSNIEFSDYCYYNKDDKVKTSNIQKTNINNNNTRNQRHDKKRHTNNTGNYKNNAVKVEKKMEKKSIWKKIFGFLK